MRPSVKTRWLRALRSDKYEQATNALQDGEGGYCCLGVLCDIVDPKGWNDDLVWTHKPKQESGEVQLPGSFRKHLEISEREQSTLMTMNDEDEYTFEEIADWIEDNL